MNKKPPDNENSFLSDEDRIIWEEFTREFIPSDTDYEVEDFAALLEADEKGEDLNAPEMDQPAHADLDITRTVRAQKTRKISNVPLQIDKATSEKLRKGKMLIEGRLDLHGYNQERAYAALTSFIIKAQETGRRHVLVITGKGKSKVSAQDWLSEGKGVLKEKVPQWLSEKQMQNYVLKFCSAQPKDGGAGALYVYLRRLRD